jgi:hypothetical protein
LLGRQDLLQPFLDVHFQLVELLLLFFRKVEGVTQVRRQHPTGIEGRWRPAEVRASAWGAVGPAGRAIVLAPRAAVAVVGRLSPRGGHEQDRHPEGECTYEQSSHGLAPFKQLGQPTQNASPGANLTPTT